MAFSSRISSPLSASRYCAIELKNRGCSYRKIENVAFVVRRKDPIFLIRVRACIGDIVIKRSRKDVGSSVRCALGSSPEDLPVKGDSDAPPNTRVLQVGVDIPVGRDPYASGARFKPSVGGGDCTEAGGNGKFPPGGGGGGGGAGDGGGGDEQDGGDDDVEAVEFGPLLKFEEVMREVESRGVKLPSDMYEAAKSIGIRKLFLENYVNLQGASWPLGFAMRNCSLLRNRILADQTFLFKVGTEVVIDSCCATFAEIQKRGKDFWSEFELYAADLLVGIAVDVAVVGMLAPYARFGKPSTSNGLLGRVARACGSLPSSVFEAERPGCSFSVQQRIATYFYKGVIYGYVGFACGIIGQGVANLIMTAKRSVKKNEDDIPVPPLLKTAALWGVFLGVSSNTRYQIINGLEWAVEASPVARRLPAVAMAFTVGIRFANNVYGGMQFVDWARWSGCQ